MSSKFGDSFDEFDRELDRVGFWTLKELSCKVLDDGKMEASGTEVLMVFNRPDGTHSDGTLRDMNEKLESVTVGMPDQFTGTAIHTDHDKPPEKVVTSSNLAARAEGQSYIPAADVFYSHLGKEQLKKCLVVPSV